MDNPVRLLLISVSRYAMRTDKIVHPTGSRCACYNVPMAPRLRLFVKKRGQRRTGSRWLGTLGVAAVDLALVSIGGVFLYWLLAHYLLAEGETHGWFAWAALVIPGALIGYGLTDLAVARVAKPGVDRAARGRRANGQRLGTAGNGAAG